MNIYQWIISLFLAVSFGAGTASGTDLERDEKPWLPVGLRKQLFVDDYVIASLSNLTRTLGKPCKENNGQPGIVPSVTWKSGV